MLGEHDSQATSMFRRSAITEHIFPLNTETVTTLAIYKAHKCLSSRMSM